MAFGKSCGNSLSSKRGGLVAEGRGLGLKRKRILISENLDVLPMNSVPSTPSENRCTEIMVLDPQTFNLEACPQDILIRILCGVNHEDLKHLFHVSKRIREATLIAKQWHFAYSTPSKFRVFGTPIYLEDASEYDDIEAPNAPKLSRHLRSRLNKKKLADISVALFSSDEERWPRKALFMETEA